jgi:hypothetical protein
MTTRVHKIPAATAGAVSVLIMLLGVLFGPAAPAGAATPAVWVGSPFKGTWPNAVGCSGATYPSVNCSLPSVHHNPYLGDWAADFQSVAAGTGVYLYAAPQNSALAITARVEIVGPACASGSLAAGGQRVTVGFYNGSNKIGTATYAHINSTVARGAIIPRWGAKLGAVGKYTPGRCWSDVHLHFEMYSQYNYACYNKGWHPGQQMYATNFVGFTGGSYATAPRRACP